MKFKLAAALITTCFLSFNHDACAADVSKGAALFAQRCAMCHGDKGAGDGPVAATIPEGQKPRNLTAGQNKYATDDAKLKEILQKGGAGVGLSVLMPAQSDLKPAEVEDLVAFVKSLKK
jgi:mono/diheme cytochrome c family protein